MRVRTRSERGQAFALMVVAMIALLGTAAIVMDVGFAWYAKRQVQASADAAALAGAQELPNVALAKSTALKYANLNLPANLDNVVVNDPVTRCSTSAGPLCGKSASFGANTIQVTETAKTPTWFAKVLGFDNFDVKGVATACQPCSSAPVDVMLVVDRTGSMCSPTGSGGSCTDLNNAKDGVQTLLKIFDPSLDTVGLVAFPPYRDNPSPGICTSQTANATLTLPNGSTVSPSNYDQAGLIYLDDPLGTDFKVSSGATALNNSSSLVQHMQLDNVTPLANCPGGINSFGSTSYDDALKAGYDELKKDGRPGVPQVLIFMTDGEANQGSYYGATVPGHGYEPNLGNPATGFDMPGGVASTINPGDAQPCQSAINAATAIKADDVTIYTIGYALGSATYCVHGVWGQIDKSWASSSNDYANFKCATIGAPVLGPNKDQSWAKNPAKGHYQGAYPAPSPSNSNNNPCTNTISGNHEEEPMITSMQTLQAIASPGNFYNKPTPGDLSTIFAAIAADITSGTSRLVDDGWGS